MYLPTSKYLLTSDLYNVMQKFSIAENTLQKVWTFHHNDPKNKHIHTNMAIILYATEPTKHNRLNCTQTLQ